MTKIEIAPKEYHIRCSYNDALLYCFQLEIDGKTGWRFPTYNEYVEEDIFGWYLSDEDRHLDSQYTIMPVRDIR